MKKVSIAVLSCALVFGAAHASSAVTPVANVAVQNDGLQKAINTANARLKGTVIGASLDDNEYDITIIKGTMKHEIELNAQGKVLKAKQKRVSRYDTAKYSAYQNAPIKLETALQTAQDKTGMNVTEIELDTKHGVLVYDIEVGDGLYKYDVVIDANSGAVITNEVPNS